MKDKTTTTDDKKRLARLKEFDRHQARLDKLEARYVHENGLYFVFRGDRGYEVHVNNGGGSQIMHEMYPPDEDGKSIAIARCNYLARTADARTLFMQTNKPEHRYRTTEINGEEI